MAWVRWMSAAALPLAMACASASKKPPRLAPEIVEAARPAEAPDASERAPVAATCEADDACPFSQICVAGRCADVVPGLAECRSVSAHFDFDRSDVREADRPALARAARCLLAIPANPAVVEGNCDERGTVEYNLALGFRRAGAVRKYLEDLGVPASQLRAVSYGKEAPVCSEPTEACWAENRRADVSSGPEEKGVAGRRAPVPARHQVRPEEAEPEAAGK